MSEKLSGFLGNDTTFGRIMTRLGIIIGTSLMFSVFCLPIVTIGPAWVALYHVMFRTLRGDGELNPFKEFWKGFKNNIKQSIVCWLAFMGIMFILWLDIRFCQYKGGVMIWFCYGLYGIGAIVIVVGLYLFPVIAAFRDTIPHQLRNAIFFVSRRIYKVPVMVLIYAIPVIVTLADEVRRPLYGFLWVVAIPGILVLLASRLLLNDFAKYLPEVDEWGEFVEKEETPPITKL